MTTLADTITALLDRVHAEPWNLDARLILADALSDAGDVEGEAFWRWTTTLKDGGIHKITTSDESWSPMWLEIPGEVRELSPLSTLGYSKRWPPSDAFARLRIGWDRARKENLL